MPICQAVPFTPVRFSTVLAVISTALLTSCHGPSGTGAGAQSVFSRVLQRGIIRCGYVSNPPSCIIDPNTRKVSGIVAEAIEVAAKAANLKVEWTEEVGFGSMVEGLRAARYDMVPCAIWPTAARAREADFSNALFYSGVSAYVRPNDPKFKGANYSAVNSPAVRIATIDGELGETIAQTDFPRAQRLGSPQMSEITTVLLNVKEHKADVAFVERYFAEQFLSKNPGSVRNLVPNHPIRIFPNTVLLPRNELDLKAFVNTALEEQVNLGTLDRLIDKYEPAPGTFYRIRAPYATAEN